jgi:hypothetical protein
MPVDAVVNLGNFTMYFFQFPKTLNLCVLAIDPKPAQLFLKPHNHFLGSPDFFLSLDDFVVQLLDPAIFAVHAPLHVHLQNLNTRFTVHVVWFHAAGMAGAGILDL